MFHFQENLVLIDLRDVYFDIFLWNLTRIQNPGLFIKVQPSLVVSCCKHKIDSLSAKHMQSIATEIQICFCIGEFPLLL